MNNKYQEALKRLRTNEYLTSREQREYYNLLQELVDKESPRTEQEILKDFEKLGWYVADGYSKEYILVLKRKETKQLYGSLNVDWYHYIFIKENSYRAESAGCWITKGYELSIQEHKLLNELFSIWGLI